MAAGLRIVTFNVLPLAYALVAGWAEAQGHRIILLVTSPAAGDRYGPGYQQLISSVPPTQDILVTTRLRRTAAPVIAALAPDLIISATFPHRIPEQVTAIPRYGAINLHPAPLPRGRGPNPPRLIYEGDEIAGATAHRIAPEFDAGAILSQRTRRLPDDLTGEAILATWGELLVEALHEGVARAVAGEPGEAQDASQATYAAPFSEEERWLRWDEPARTLQRRAAALNLTAPTARATIDGQPMVIASLRARPGAATAAPGTVLSRVDETAAIAVADGAVEVTLFPVTPVD